MSERTPLPRTPAEDDDDASFLGSFMKNFFVVNGLMVMGALAVPNYGHTMGATASSRCDPRTKQPVLQEMRGCRVVNSDADSGKPPPPRRK